MNHLATVFNPKLHPVAISSDGVELGGYQSAECDLHDPVVSQALKIGHLTIVSVADTPEVANFSTPAVVEEAPVPEAQEQPKPKKRSPRKKPAQAKEN